MDATLQDQIDDATFDFTMGDGPGAIKKLESLAATHPESFDVWHALTEVYFGEGDYDRALSAGQKAVALKPDDIHINTSLSRIWVQKGDKAKAEHYGAQARMLGWKETLQSPPDAEE